jgi:antitoxin component of MazEF toxin-antitoxin module
MFNRLPELLMTVIAKKIGGSVAVVIPKAIAREMELTEGASLEISNTPQGILLRRRTRRPRRPFSQLVAQIKPSSYRRRRRELGDDPPVGKEIW